MKIESILEILKLCDKESPASRECETEDRAGLVKIVLLQRGWVIIGEFYQSGNNCYVENGFVIRKWGTTKGLGELAISGKRPDTILDSIPRTDFHILTTIAVIHCDQEKWK